MLEVAILQTVHYADIFNFPLTLPEIERYLIGQPAAPGCIEDCLDHSPSLQTHLSRQDGYVCLRGREELFERRKGQEALVKKQWQAARRWGKILQMVPFLRGAVVTGSLAAGSAAARDDIDLLLLVEPGRLWSCRALVIGVVYLARLTGVELCPNYLLAFKDESLALQPCNLYTARELAGMQLLFGKAAYSRLLALNRWVTEWLPNTTGLPDPAALLVNDRPGKLGQGLKKTGETLLAGWLGDRFERWEQRKIARLARPEAPETAFTADVCKGHFGNYGSKTLEAFNRRCAIIETIPTPK